MIHFTRTVAVLPGQMAAAMAFAREMIGYLDASHGKKPQLMMPIGGNPHRLCWYSAFDNLGEMEAFHARTLSDPQYMKILSTAAPLFVPGSTHDDIWRDV